MCYKYYAPSFIRLTVVPLLATELELARLSGIAERSSPRPSERESLPFHSRARPLIPIIQILFFYSIWNSKNRKIRKIFKLNLKKKRTYERDFTNFQLDLDPLKFFWWMIKSVGQSLLENHFFLSSQIPSKVDYTMSWKQTIFNCHGILF
jgi:hypothetical protein